MSGLNKVMLIGNLGADPVRRLTPAGTPVTNFNIATTERFADKAGELHERTEWHRIVAWGRLAEVASEYLKKGQQVYIEGRIRTQSWEDKDSIKRSTMEVHVSSMVMLGRRNGASAEPGDAAATPEPVVDIPAGDDGLPF